MGKTIYEKNDNTSVQRPVIQQFFARKEPSKEEQDKMWKMGYTWSPVDKEWHFRGTISDLGGEPSTDTRTSTERNRDYLHWWKGANERWKDSWNNGTNPVKGALDVGLGYVNPVTAVANAAYDIYDSYNQLSSPQGLAKTWGLIKSGNLGRAAVSAAGDALAAADLIPGVPETPRLTSSSASRRLVGGVPEDVYDRMSLNERHELLQALIDGDTDVQQRIVRNSGSKKSIPDEDVPDVSVPTDVSAGLSGRERQDLLRALLDGDTELYERITRNRVPEEYRGRDFYSYDGSYPLQYYKGVDTPEGLTTDQLLTHGILGETSGLFTEDQLKNLSPEALDAFIRRSQGLSVEGVHGRFFNPSDDPAKQALQYLLNKGRSNSSIMSDIKKSDRSGYVNFPHSLSIDSWPIWELQSLRHSDKAVPIPIELFKKTVEGRQFFYDNGIPYATTNMFGIGNRIDASPELQKFLKQNPSLDINDFIIKNMDNGRSKVLYDGQEVGTIRMLNNEETLNKFNEVRRRLYARDPSKYPGDAVTSDLDFEYMVPFVPTQVKKKGGRLNAKLVKRNKK